MAEALSQCKGASGSQSTALGGAAPACHRLRSEARRLQIDFEALAGASPNAYMLVDRQLNYAWANAAYLRTVGREWSEIAGRYIFDAFPESGEPRRLLQTSFETVLREGRADTIALIPYAIERPAALGGGLEHRWWTAVHTPLRAADGSVAFVLQQTSDVTELQHLRAAADAAERRADEAVAERDLFARARELQRANLGLLAESQRLRRLFDQAPGFICVLREPTHIFEFANAAYLRLVGRDVIGKSVAEALPEVAEQGFVQLLDNVHASRQPFVGRETPIMLQREPGAELEACFLDFIYQPIVEADGRVSGVFVEGYDVTERVRAQKHERLLLDELNHRVKNTLSSVQAIAVQTIRSSTTLAEFGPAFEARLLALSQTHNLLTARQWRGASLSDILDQELRPFAAARIERDGPPVNLPARAALAVAMAVHELATNAVKYGALSNPDGRLTLRWALQPGDTFPLLRLSWIESGGPPVQPPGRRGFGTRLIQRTIGGELGGAAELDYRPAGLAAVLTLPLEEAQDATWSPTASAT